MTDGERIQLLRSALDSIAHYGEFTYDGYHNRNVVFIRAGNDLIKIAEQALLADDDLQMEATLGH